MFKAQPVFRETLLEQAPQIYARMVGVVQLLCPKCGQFIRHQTTARGPWIASCTRSGCEARYALGIAVRPVCTGFKQPPIDQVFPTTSKHASLWRNGQRINLLLPDETPDNE